MSSFYYGYAVVQIPGGWLAARFGGMPLLLGAVVAWSAFTALTPPASSSLWLLVGARVCMGLAEGISFPAIHHMIGYHVAHSEQSTAVGIVTAGSYIGTVVANYLTPQLIGWLDWQSAFYCFAAMGLVWAVVSAFVVNRRVVLGSDGQFQRLRDQRHSHHHTSVVTVSTAHGGPSSMVGIPWRQLLTCKQVWAIVINQFCSGWGFYVLLNWIPTYYNTVYHIKLQALGILLIVPYFVQGFVGVCVGYAADWMMHGRDSFTAVQTRRIFQIPGMVVPAVVLLLLAYMPGLTASKAMALLTIALGTNALTLAGVSAYQLDFAPKVRYAIPT